MNSDPTSLSHLHDIVVPDPVPLWPPAPGWLWLLGMLAIALMVILVRSLMRFQRNRYRREALKELSRLQMRATSGDATALAELSILLKRTALTVFPREQVAGLTGESWFAFLDRCGGTRFAAGPGKMLEDCSYRTAPLAPESDPAQQLFAEVHQWIQRHRAPEDAAESSANEETGASTP